MSSDPGPDDLDDLDGEELTEGSSNPGPPDGEGPPPHGSSSPGPEEDDERPR
jgi:hypothetical protein